MKYSKLWIVMAALAAVGGLFFLGVAAMFGYDYIAEPGNPLRHEALQGVALAIFMAAPFWLAISATLWPVRAKMPLSLYVCANGITAVICVLIFAAFMYPLIMIALGK
ncbi:hypothetical protein [Marinimicrobium agarilyticum]|uniref:hypothetical protein n=1 Tax=Marinimicrobium agarilyticum TaxID=306546 RepID=UPI0004810EC1|nr:hypothetical protein [Marinimicrobium agarilyticum]